MNWELRIIVFTLIPNSLVLIQRENCYNKLMKKNWFFLFTIVLFVGGIGAYYTFFMKSGELTTIDSFEKCVAAGLPILESYPAQCRTNDGKIFTEEIGNEMELTDMIRVSSPRPNQYLTSPVIITGEARGTWFFEASAPVKLLDNTGKVIAQGVIRVEPTVSHVPISPKNRLMKASDSAEGSWMTTEFVPFKGELTFSNPPSPKAKLVLEKDNPSGMPENAKQLTIPVYLK